MSTQHRTTQQTTQHTQQQQQPQHQGGENKMGGTPKEELRNKDYTTIFSELWNKFTQHYEDFMSGQKQGLNDIFETAKNNYEYLKQRGSEGAENVSEQLKDKNSKLMEKLSSTNESAKQTIKQYYDKLTGSNEPDAQKHTEQGLQHLKQSFRDALNNVGDSSTDAYRHAMKRLDEFQGNSKEEYEKFYNEMNKNLDAVYNESCGKIKQYFSYDGQGQNVQGEHTAKAS